MTNHKETKLPLYEEYKRIELPYGLNDLEHIISYETMRYHYVILHKNYEDKLLKTLRGIKIKDKSKTEEDFPTLIKLLENLEILPEEINKDDRKETKEGAIQKSEKLKFTEDRKEKDDELGKNFSLRSQKNENLFEKENEKFVNLLSEEQKKAFYLAGSKRDQKRWQKIDILVIDEISMLEGDLLDKLELIARKIRKNNYSFGGLQLIFSGDFFQLPPVAKGRSLPKLCFESQSWKNCLDHSILLTEIHRQNESKLIKLLNEVRFGKISSSGLEVMKELEEEPNYPDDSIKAVQLSATNEEVNRINSTELDKLPYQLRSYQAID
nr:7933_t:CDS:2 [Entrophospora candida]